MRKVYRIIDQNGDDPRYNLRLLDLFELTDWTSDELDTITELRCGESFKTNDGYTVTRQDS